MGTLTISMAIFHSYVTNYQRVQCSRHLWCSRHFKTRLVDDYMDIMGLYSIPSGCVKIAVENSHRNGWWIPIKNGDFLNSYVAVYQRVRPPTCDFNVFKTGAWTTNQSGCWFQQLLIWIHMILWIVVIYYVFFSWDGRIVMSRLLNWQTCKLKPLKWDGLVGATWWHKWHPTIMATDTIEKSCYIYLWGDVLYFPLQPPGGHISAWGNTWMTFTAMFCHEHVKVQHSKRGWSAVSWGWFDFTYPTVYHGCMCRI